MLDHYSLLITLNIFIFHMFHVSTVRDTFETNLSQSFLGRSEHLGGTNSIGPEDCCYEFYPRRIKKELLVSYEMTDHRCARRAALFVTQKSHRICVDPSLSWVQNIMKTLDEKSF
uniref:Chemokine interleukin-8-like domain-containing protein n=1 Tax=Mastacembelus armatus TaxID=205130 RepID=A0A3Q3KVW1_9TELE